MAIRASDLVDDILRAHPATLRVFLRHGLGCIGCPIGTFHSLEDACREHQVALAPLLDEVRRAAAGAGESAAGAAACCG